MAAGGFEPATRLNSPHYRSIARDDILEIGEDQDFAPLIHTVFRR